MISVTVQGRMPASLTERHIARAVREAFRVARKSERGSVGVRFVTENAIAKLNATYRKIRRPTDVLSFSAMPPGPGMPKGEWGDIVIASAYARREAARRGIAPEEEIVRLVVHGTLHLLGFDHRTEREEHNMFSRQERAVERVTSAL